MYVSALFGTINVYVTSSTKVLQYSEKERETSISSKTPKNLNKIS